MPVQYGSCLLLSIVLLRPSIGLLPVRAGSSVQPTATLGADDDPSLYSFSLNQPGEHVFHFRQVHDEQMTLLLNVKGSTGEPDRPQLTHFRTTIEITLLNHAGRTVCRASGSPKDGVSVDSWVLGTARGQSAFWHRNCAEIRLRRSERYTLTIRIRDVDPNAPKIEVTPSFERSDAYGP